MSKYILFYSVNCQHSGKILQILQRFPEINSEFQKIALETLRKIPDGLTEVPTILETESGSVAGGQRAFDWLAKKVKTGFVPGPNISSKHGIEEAEFSFIGSGEQDYTQNYTMIGKEKDTGSNIDPKQFDSRTGRPVGVSEARTVDEPLKKMSEAEFKIYNERMNNQQASNTANIPVEQAYKMMEARGAPSIEQRGQDQRNREQESFNYAQLPPGLRPTDVTKTSKMPDLQDLEDMRNRGLRR